MADLSRPGYPVPRATVRTEIVVRKSRFLTTLARAPSPSRAREIVDSVRSEFPDATHHCWAFQAGAPGSSGMVGLSDAGEPHGTAGRPILDALLHSGVGEIAAVVSRWYGGVKLGKGGLARAYADAVAGGLEGLPLVLRAEARTIDLEVGYVDVDAVQRVARDHFAALVDETYGASVRYEVAVPLELVAAFTAAMAEATAGRAVITTRVERERGDAP